MFMTRGVQRHTKRGAGLRRTVALPPLDAYAYNLNIFCYFYHYYNYTCNVNVLIDFINSYYKSNETYDISGSNISKGVELYARPVTLFSNREAS